MLAKRLTTILRETSVGNSKVDTNAAVPREGSTEQSIYKGALAAAEINPLMTEGPSEHEHMTVVLPTTHKERNGQVCLVMTDMLKEMLECWGVQPVYILSSSEPGEHVPWGTANLSWILQAVLGKGW